MNQDRRKELVAEAKEIARRVDSWVGLSNALSDPVGGLIARYFPASGSGDFKSEPKRVTTNVLLRGSISSSSSPSFCASCNSSLKVR